MNMNPDTAADDAPTRWKENKRKKAVITEATKKYDIAAQICNECNDWNTADDPIIFSRHGDPKHLDHNPETDRYVTDNDTQYAICSGCFSDIMESDVLREKAYNTILDIQTRNLSK